MVMIAARRQRREVFGGHAVAREQRAKLRLAETCLLPDHRVRGEKLALRHRDRAAEVRGEPRRIAEMVGVAMRRDDAADRTLIECRRKVLAPVGASRRVAIAAIDERVAVVFGNQPQVHVVQRERQRHSQPEDPGRDFDRAAG